MRYARLELGGKLDRYVGGLYLGAYLTSLLLVVGLTVILDIASNLKYFEPWDDGTSASTSLIVNYYALQVPFLFLQVAPFVTVSASLFSVIKLIRYNELTAALNAGLSTQRVLAPVLLGGFLGAVGMFVVREEANALWGERRDVLHDILQEQTYERSIKDVWFRDAAGSIIHFDKFHPVQPSFPNASGTGLVVAMQSGATVRVARADTATWEDGQWRLENGTLSEETGSAATKRAIESLDGFVAFTPRDVFLCLKGYKRPLELSFSEVGELIRRDPDNREYQTLLQYHLTFPLANVVLLLVALPFLVGRERGRRLEGLAIACAMVVLYFATDFVSRSLGMDGSLSPLISSWLPVLLFGSLGVVLFEGLRT